MAALDRFLIFSHYKAVTNLNVVRQKRTPDNLSAIVLYNSSQFYEHDSVLFPYLESQNCFVFYHKILVFLQNFYIENGLIKVK